MHPVRMEAESGPVAVMVSARVGYGTDIILDRDAHLAGSTVQTAPRRQPGILHNIDYHSEARVLEP